MTKTDADEVRRLIDTTPDAHPLLVRHVARSIDRALSSERAALVQAAKPLLAGTESWSDTRAVFAIAWSSGVADTVDALRRAADADDLSLAKAPLTGAYLYGAKLVRANLRGAALPMALLSGANLEGANLRRANLRSESADLRGADLSGADLTSADLREAKLGSADLTDADLSGVTCDATTTWPEGFEPPEQPVEVVR
jgi:hypothetical protein